MVSRGHAVLLVLSAVAGSTDAISYLGLGKVFPANMTGNTVLLAIGTTDGDYAAAGRSAVALAGFVCGAIVTAFMTARADKSTILTTGLACELGVLGAAYVLWLSTGDNPGSATWHCLIALAGLAMGTQSATVTSLDVGVSTTYITGTWTALSRRMGSWLRGARDQPDTRQTGLRTQRQALVLATYLGAALAAGCVVRWVSPAIADSIPFALLATALAMTCRLGRRTAG